MSSGAGSADVAQGASGASGASNSTLYLGIGIGVGSFLLISIAVVIFQIIRKGKKHRKEIAQLEQGPEVTEIQPVPRPVEEIARRSNHLQRMSLLPIQTQAGWDALSSNEEVNDHEKKKKSRFPSVALPKRMKKNGVPLKKLKHLSAIIESPRSRSGKTLGPADQVEWETAVVGAVQEHVTSSPDATKPTAFHPMLEDDNTDCPGSPRPEVMPSFAVRPELITGYAFADAKPKAPRSISVGAFPGQAPDTGFYGQHSRLTRPQMHARSISLGAQAPSQPPSDPVPPLPKCGAHMATRTSMAFSTPNESRRGLCISRSSSSSTESASSSVLVTSPILQMKSNQDPVASPTVEQVVADDEDAELKSVSGTCNQWHSPHFARPYSAARMRKMSTEASKASLHSTCGAFRQRVSSISSVSSLDDSDNENMPSAKTSAIADHPNLSRVSSMSSSKTSSGLRRVTTPRKAPRSTVSASGSPAERRKTGVLQDISGNSTTPHRQPSNATQRSTNSSNGNPFQWDTTNMHKPSALKGSPNARKGHKRQNCVRISTLTPQVLGPPPSRPTSPNIMHGIEEENFDEKGIPDPHGRVFVSNQKLPRPASANLATYPRVHAIRASLTPSSPTLSMWAAYQEHELQSQPSDSNLSTSSCGYRSVRLSRGSLNSPILSNLGLSSKATFTENQRDQPVPEFCLSRPSTDDEDMHASSPFPPHTSSGLQKSSSSPSMLEMSNKEYDPAWPAIQIPTSAGAKQYDPASPAVACTDPERSSPFFASTVTLSRETSSAGRFPSLEDAAGDSPPCSPKTMPETSGSFPDRPNRDGSVSPVAEKLTSENASSIMARLPNVGFPSAPILRPPMEDNPVPAPLWAKRNRAISIATGLLPKPPPPPPSISPDRECMPEPLQMKHAPLGPRTEPARSVLKNAMALRRMNSEVDTTRSRESRRYIRLGRESSPELPMIGSPEPSESCNDLFDFGFGNERTIDTGAGAAEMTKALSEMVEGIWYGSLTGDLNEHEAMPMEGREKSVDMLPTLHETPRSASVRDSDGHYWRDGRDLDQAVKFKTSGRDHGEHTPKKGEHDAAEEVRRSPASGEQHRPFSITETPRSLYDADGFLRY